MVIVIFVPYCPALFCVLLPSSAVTQRDFLPAAVVYLQVSFISCAEV